MADSARRALAAEAIAEAEEEEERRRREQEAEEAEAEEEEERRRRDGGDDDRAQKARALARRSRLDDDTTHVIPLDAAPFLADLETMVKGAVADAIGQRNKGLDTALKAIQAELNAIQTEQDAATKKLRTLSKAILEIGDDTAAVAQLIDPLNKSLNLQLQSRTPLAGTGTSVVPPAPQTGTTAVPNAVQLAEKGGIGAHATGGPDGSDRGKLITELHALSDRANSCMQERVAVKGYTNEFVDRLNAGNVTEQDLTTLRKGVEDAETAVSTRDLAR